MDKKCCPPECCDGKDCVPCKGCDCCCCCCANYKEGEKCSCTSSEPCKNQEKK